MKEHNIKTVSDLEKLISKDYYSSLNEEMKDRLNKNIKELAKEISDNLSKNGIDIVDEVEIVPTKKEIYIKLFKSQVKEDISILKEVFKNKGVTPEERSINRKLAFKNMQRDLITELIEQEERRILPKQPVIKNNVRIDSDESGTSSTNADEKVTKEFSFMKMKLPSLETFEKIAGEKLTENWKKDIVAFLATMQLYSVSPSNVTMPLQDAQTTNSVTDSITEFVERKSIFDGVLSRNSTSSGTETLKTKPTIKVQKGYYQAYPGGEVIFDDSYMEVQTTVNKPVFYSQLGYYDELNNWHDAGWDDDYREKYDKYWASTQNGNITTSGCQITAIASGFATILQDPTINPITIAEIVGNYSNADTLGIEKAAEYYGLNIDGNIDISNPNIDGFLKKGGVMIYTVNNGTHWLAVLGIDDNENYILCQPNFDKAAVIIPRDETLDLSLRKTDNAAQGRVVLVAPKGYTVEELLNNTLIQSKDDVIKQQDIVESEETTETLDEAHKIEEEIEGRHTESTQMQMRMSVVGNGFTKIDDFVSQDGIKGMIYVPNLFICLRLEKMSQY